MQGDGCLASACRPSRLPVEAFAPRHPVASVQHVSTGHGDSARAGREASHRRAAVKVGAVALATHLGRAVRPRGKKRVLPVVRAASRTAAAAGEGSPWSDEARSLKQAADSLRTEIQALEDELAEQKWQEQLQWFKTFDANGDGTVDLEELRKGMKKLIGTELDEHTAKLLLQELDANKNGVIEMVEFNTAQVEATLERIQREQREKDEIERKAAAAEQEAQAQAKELANITMRYYDSLPPRNHDRSVVTRFLSMSVYLLPLFDLFRFVAPVVAEAGGSSEAMATLRMLISMEQSSELLPFAHLAVFLAFQFLAEDRRLPHLLRFNLRQAVVINVILGAIALFELLLAAGIHGSLLAKYEVEHWDGNLLIIGCFMLTLAYCCTRTALGKLPDNVPAVSTYVKRTMRPTRPRWVDELKAVAEHAASKKKEKDEDSPRDS